jgi:F0F1-type ATP synthase membrane subunit c/vacuolar-type H+-ATPase subunit K
MQATASTLLVSHRRGVTVSFVREKPGAASLVGLAAAVAGLVIGRTAVGVAGRSAATPEQEARRRYGVLLAVMVLGAALLIIVANDTEAPYVNLAVLAIMVGGVAFDWLRSRRRRTRSEPSQQSDDE